MDIKKIALTILIGSLAITGCSSKDEPKPESSRSSRKRPAATSATKPKARTRAVVETQVGQSFSDAALGFDIAINRFLKNVPYDADVDLDDYDGMVNVFVELTGTNNSNYYASINTTDFKLKTASGEPIRASNDYKFRDYISDNAITTLYDKSISQETAETRWLIFEVREKDIDGKLILKYDREEADSTSGKIPRFTYDILLN